MQSITSKNQGNRTPVSGKHGMVACSQPLATHIGIEILKAGGNAIDAAIASNAALGLMEPHMCGLGGDLFAIVWDAESRRLYGLNASGRSPKGLSYDDLLKILRQQELEKIPTYGVLPVSVPGAVDGWFNLHDGFGRLSMGEILKPVIHHAENGFPLTPVIAEGWNEWANALNEHVSGDFQRVYRPGGQIPGAGQQFTNPALAESYQLIAELGCDAFYRGAIGERIVAYMAEHGGYLKEEDFTEYRAEWVNPISVNYRGYDVYELPPNGQGLAALQMLKILEHDELSALGAMSSDAVHLMLEAKKQVFEDRAQFYADLEYGRTPVAELLSNEYSRLRRGLIGQSAARVIKAGDPRLRQSDTVYLATADKEGNMVSLIQSIYHPFGSGVVVPGTGFALQNRGMSFSLDVDHANVYAAGKRPFHTIIPAFILREGKPFMSFGVMGGDMQPQGHVQILTNMIDFGMNLQEAGDALRWRHDQSTDPSDNTDDYLRDGGTVLLEEGFEQTVIDELARRGHRIELENNDFLFGGYQAIMRDEDGVYHGASERRKDGCALGY